MLGTYMRIVTLSFPFLVASILAGACSASIAPIGTKVAADAGDSGGGGGGGGGGSDASFDLDIQPANSFSGVDGTHTFKVPIAIYRAGDDLKVTVSDPSIADVRPAKSLAGGGSDNGRYYMLTAKKAGVVDITGTSNGKTITAKLTVQDYAAGRYAAGEGRYKTGPDSDNPSCASCHQKAGGADHSPAALASVNDDEIQAIITSGVKPGGVPIIGPKHTWLATQPQLEGLVTYLRALPPLGFQEQ